MRAKKIVAMLLAGGQGSRLQVLTVGTAKPAVPYGGKYRIIDFPLSNCTNSDIDTVGVLTQYRPLELNSYIGNGTPWDLNRNHGGVFVLPPYATGEVGEWYLGTANAISQNIGFIDQYRPSYVLILSGDHIYKMDYAQMLDRHIERGADCTIAVLPVPIEEASRFGIMETDESGHIIDFQEKPAQPKSNLASMGIYIFDWPKLRAYLHDDDEKPGTSHDFGKDIIPSMLADGQKMFAYRFNGYWKDVGTIQSLWESNMDLLEDPPAFNLYDPEWRIYSRNPVLPPHYIDDTALVTNSIISEGAEISGSVAHSVIFSGVTIGEGAFVSDSVIMPGANIGKNARICKAIIGERAEIGEGVTIGDHGKDDPGHDCEIAVLGEEVVVPSGTQIPCGAVIGKDPFHADKR